MSTRDLAKIILIVLPVLIVIVAIYIILFVPINGTLICNDNFSIGELRKKSTYTVKFKKRKVNSIIFTQTITSQNEDAIIDYQKTLLESMKDNKDLNKNEELSYDGTKLQYEIKTNYNKTDKKISIGELKKIYKEIGTTCKYK